MAGRTHMGCLLCETCGEVTPHSRRRFPTRRWLVFGLLLLVAIAARGLAGPVGLYVAAALSVVAAGVWAHGRSRGVDEACDRCRGRIWVQHRRSAPTLKGNTEINLL